MVWRKEFGFEDDCSGSTQKPLPTAARRSSLESAPAPALAAGATPAAQSANVQPPRQRKVGRRGKRQQQRRGSRTGNGSDDGDSPCLAADGTEEWEPDSAAAGEGTPACVSVPPLDMSGQTASAPLPGTARCDSGGGDGDTLTRRSSDRGSGVGTTRSSGSSSSSGNGKDSGRIGSLGSHGGSGRGPADTDADGGANADMDDFADGDGDGDGDGEGDGQESEGPAWEESVHATPSFTVRLTSEAEYNAVLAALEAFRNRSGSGDDDDDGRSCGSGSGSGDDGGTTDRHSARQLSLVSDTAGEVKSTVQPAAAPAAARPEGGSGSGVGSSTGKGGRADVVRDVRVGTLSMATTSARGSGSGSGSGSGNGKDVASPGFVEEGTRSAQGQQSAPGGPQSQFDAPIGALTTGAGASKVSARQPPLSSRTGGGVEGGDTLPAAQQSMTTANRSEASSRGDTAGASGGDAAAADASRRATAVGSRAAVQHSSSAIAMLAPATARGADDDADGAGDALNVGGEAGTGVGEGGTPAPAGAGAGVCTGGKAKSRTAKQKNAKVCASRFQVR
jgi:hypothetical protein